MHCLRAWTDGGSNAISVAEHTVMLILCLYRRMLYSWANARAGNWRSGLNTEQVLELSGKTVGVIGFGNVGRQVTRKLGGFDVKVLYFLRRLDRCVTCTHSYLHRYT